MKDRATFLRESLATRLDSQSDRLSWLREQLENYVERWLGFTSDTSVSMKSLLTDDFFTMLSVATDLYGTEKKKAPVQTGAGEWQHFVTTLEKIKKTKDRSIAAELLTAFRSYQKTHDR